MNWLRVISPFCTSFHAWYACLLCAPRGCLYGYLESVLCQSPITYTNCYYGCEPSSTYPTAVYIYPIAVVSSAAAAAVFGLLPVPILQLVPPM
jgi:hypothetical protein